MSDGSQSLDVDILSLRLLSLLPFWDFQSFLRLILSISCKMVVSEVSPHRLSCCASHAEKQLQLITIVIIRMMIISMFK